MDSRDNVPVTMTITIKAESYVGLMDAIHDIEHYEMDGNIQRVYPFTDSGRNGPNDCIQFSYAYTVKEQDN